MRPRPALRLRPIGVVRSPYKDPADLPPPAFASARFFEKSTGTIEIDPAYAPGLAGIEGFSHIIVLFHFHRAGGAKLRVVPPGEKRPRGVFATRSPHRPNPLGLSVLRLLGRRGRVLKVSGLDLIDGTPILDIKPYTRRDRKSRITTGWLDRRRRAGR
ncbi:MAG TPA: tRNA (N6-threonylcarbamoyladenosine(37)-N6)-methyltransferase TrmO [Acidobacteriota bacterium]|nr:tRNA (N6-threonylcarbamoyladenosine(37)-N6)-methyltransferase TrmO [Acidobacteriota bacterium]